MISHLAKNPNCRKVPRLFIFDCCDGQNAKQHQYRDIEAHDDLITITEENANEIEHDLPKHVSLSKVHGGESLVWAQDEDNPDYRLITIHAANQGFQSKMSKEIGSYVITGFTRLLKDNIMNRNNDLFLYEIFDNIQTELHDKGKQHTVNIFNDGTRFVKFLKHDVNNGDGNKGMITESRAKLVQIHTNTLSESTPIDECENDEEVEEEKNELMKGIELINSGTEHMRYDKNREESVTFDNMVFDHQKSYAL